MNQDLALMQDFQTILQTSPSLAFKHRQWLPPSEGVLKLKVDGAIFTEVGRAGVGCVLRDPKGDILMAKPTPNEC